MQALVELLGRIITLLPRALGRLLGRGKGEEGKKRRGRDTRPIDIQRWHKKSH